MGSGYRINKNYYMWIINNLKGQTINFDFLFTSQFLSSGEFDGPWVKQLLLSSNGAYRYILPLKVTIHCWYAINIKYCRRLYELFDSID